MQLSHLIALTRLDKPVGVWLTFLPASWAVLLAACAHTGVDFAVLFACFVGAALARSAGCILNDLADRKLDAHVERTKHRPLASGAVSVRQALVVLALIGALALGVALLLPPLVLWLALGAIPLIAAYPFMKRITWWPQLFLGVTFNLSALMGWAAATGTLAPAAFWLYAGAVVWTFGYDTLYAHQDRADDARVGIKSSARALGQRTVRVVGFAYALFIACLVAAGVSATAPTPYFVGVFAAAAHLIWQLIHCEIDDAARMGQLFRSNVHTGALIAAGALIGALNL